MSASAYLVGRPALSAQPIASQTGALFASQLLDGTSICDVTYIGCTFANVSFKDAQLERVRFSNCVFIDCYFRDTKLTNSTLSACKFIDCDLTKIDIRGCDLRNYNTFSGCYLPYDAVEQSLPSEGNLRAHLCLNLSDESRRAGALKDADSFRQAGAKGREGHLWNAARHSNAYYKDKFKGVNRAAALAELCGSKLRGWTWGYKRSFLVVLRNWMLLTLVVFPGLLALNRHGLQLAGAPLKPSVGQLLTASAGNMLPGSGISKIEFTTGWARTWAFTEVLIGLLLTGVAAALLFRAIFERVR